MKSFDDSFFKGCQKYILLNNFFAFGYLFRSRIKIILNLQKSYVFRETICMFDVFAVDDFRQFEEVEYSVILNTFVEN